MTADRPSSPTAHLGWGLEAARRLGSAATAVAVEHDAVLATGEQWPGAGMAFALCALRRAESERSLRPPEAPR